MKNFDVIIVGAGPAGLRCAEVLAPTGMSILVLEKKQEIGPKVCAGGITRKVLNIYDLPDSLLELKINRAILHSQGQTLDIHYEQPFAFTLDRKALGQWQVARLKNTQVEIRTNAQATNIGNGTLEVNHEEVLGFRYLVGADGPTSLVRRYLRIPIKKRVVALQYLIPRKGETNMEIFMDSSYFHSGYAWIFPHREHIAVGCGANPHRISPDSLKYNFHRWLKEKNYDISNAQYQSSSLSYDYHGMQFNNIFLIGDAAGLTSGLTGEGIYPALVSGQVAAQSIIYDIPPDVALKDLLRYKRIQEVYLSLLDLAGPFRDSFLNLTLWSLNYKGFREYVRNGFS